MRIVARACHVVALGLAAILFLSYSTNAWAISPFGYIEGFENDSDSFDPSDPTPPFTGGSGYPGVGVGDVSVGGEDWGDVRALGWDGLIEEIPSSSSAYSLVPASSGSGLGIVYPGAANSYDTGLRNGPFGRLGRTATNPGPGGAGAQFSFQMDLYTESTSGSGSLWWTNAVQGISPSVTYLTETGFSITPGAGAWNFTTTSGGHPSVGLPTNEWYTLEVVYDTAGANLSAIHNIFNHDHTELLYSETVSPLFGSPLSTQLGGARYSWFAVWDNNATDRLFVDNIGVGVPLELVVIIPAPEPTSLLLMAGLMLPIALRRKDR